MNLYLMTYDFQLFYVVSAIALHAGILNRLTINILYDDFLAGRCFPRFKLEKKSFVRKAYEIHCFYYILCLVQAPFQKRLDIAAAVRKSI